MGWLKVDDKFKNHPKALKAGLEAIGLWLLAACWASEYESDGHLPEHVVQYLPGFRPELADRLVEAGLWARTADGYAIHDFLKYNPSRAEQDAKRAAACERMAKGRRSSREVQANSQSTSQKQEETFARSSSVPIPIPFPKEKEEEGPPARAISTAPEAKAGDPSAAPLAWKALREAASERLNAGKAFATATGLPMAQEADWRRSWEQAREVYTLEDLRKLGRALTARAIWRLDSPITAGQLIKRLADLLAEAVAWDDKPPKADASAAPVLTEEEKAKRERQKQRDAETVAHSLACMRREGAGEPPGPLWGQEGYTDAGS